MTPPSPARVGLALRPHRMPVVVTVWMALCAVPAVLAVVVPRRVSDPWLGALALACFAWAAWRAWRVGLDVDAEHLVHRGWFATRRYPRAAVESVRRERYVGYFSGHKPGRGLSMLVVAMAQGHPEAQVRELVGRDATVERAVLDLRAHLGVPGPDATG